MRPVNSRASLPKDGHFQSDDEYVSSLLTFATSCELFQKLCGGVHILDFLIKEPDLYTSLLPQDWRDWFGLYDISDILDFLMREETSVLERLRLANGKDSEEKSRWCDGGAPPITLLDYILAIRRHSLGRDFVSNVRVEDDRHVRLRHHVTAGMKPKKIHEVEHFVKFIDNLSEHIASSSPHSISHIVDFGSGQNYLGRALISPPFNRRVIALESKHVNVDGARSLDVHAKLTEKEKIMRNKKQYRLEMHGKSPSAEEPQSSTRMNTTMPQTTSNRPPCHIPPVSLNQCDNRLLYCETLIEDGNLSQVIRCIPNNSTASPSSDLQLMVISLHSCGNLSHHAVRSIVLNPSVKVVAVIGCCYNLVTERLGPATYKVPSLRSSNLRLDSTSSACDPHGFPMSKKLATFKHDYGEGVRLNITARMMAVQAPWNWTKADSESFFTRHFYRALLQKIFLDREVVSKPVEIDGQPMKASSPRGWTGTDLPITIGSLRKSCYTSFDSYVHGALAKLTDNGDYAERIEKHMQGLTDAEIECYEKKYFDKKKALSIVWTLMAFSAGVVESIIVVDRWLYLREQELVKECWVEPIFDYGQSPRNLVVVGIKK